MIWVGRLIDELIRLPCTAHTLQLVVKKGLLLVETLIAWAKRLINFFIISKQTEKLIEIQRTCHTNNKVVNYLNNFIVLNQMHSILII